MSDLKQDLLDSLDADRVHRWPFVGPGHEKLRARLARALRVLAGVDQ